MHPDDAEQLGLAEGQRVAITSKRGMAHSTLNVVDSVSPGVVCMPIHWNDLFAEGASPNEATTNARDPGSLQPALKCCAVRVVPAMV